MLKEGFNIRNIRQLNISNTYRSSNCNVCVRKKPSQIIDINKMTPQKLHKLYKDSKKKKSFDKVFLFHHKKHEDKSDEAQIARDGLPFLYYSDSVFPIQIVLACHPNKHAYVIYNYQGRRVTDREITSIHFAYMTCQVGVNIPIVIGKSDPIRILANLYDIKFWIKRAFINFTGFTKKQLKQHVYTKDQPLYKKYGNLYYPNSKARLMYYDKLHEVLARYRMQLFMVSENPLQAKYLKEKGLQIANK